MKKRLIKIYWASVAGILAMALFLMGALVISKVADTGKSLLSILSTASAWTEDSTRDLSSLAQSIAESAEPLRVTFLLPQGIALADSEKSALDMESLLDLPEIQDALKGRPEARVGMERGVLTVSAARQISPRLILRLHSRLTWLNGVLAIYALALAAVLILLLLLFRRVLRAFSGQLIGQINSIQAMLSGAMRREELRPESFYPELRPALNEIIYRVDRLKDDLEEVRLAQNMRREFAANASHELKSPLTSIQGFAEMLYEGMADSPEEQAEYLERILGESARMRAVIDDILLLSRAEIAADEPLVEVDCRRVAEEVAAALAGQARLRGISIAVEGEMSLSAVEKDVWEIFYNLMSNAVRYGRDGGHVRVRTLPGTLIVEDDGIGIAQEHLALIFEKFYRVDKAHSRSDGGTGLGLSIVARLVEKYGGKIWAESEEGRGSRFIARFVRSV